MPTSVDNFELYRAMEGVERALKSISTGAGYNTTPKVGIGTKQIREVPIADMPMLRLEMEDITPDGNQFGGASQGEIRMSWTFFVWGFVGTRGTKKDLYRAGQALLADVYAAIYADETQPDGAGQGTAIAVEPGDIAFDMESLTEDSKGYFMASFVLITDITRGSNP